MVIGYTYCTKKSMHNKALLSESLAALALRKVHHAPNVYKSIITGRRQPTPIRAESDCLPARLHQAGAGGGPPGPEIAVLVFRTGGCRRARAANRRGHARSDRSRRRFQKRRQTGYRFDFEIQRSLATSPFVTIAKRTD